MLTYTCWTHCCKRGARFLSSRICPYARQKLGKLGILPCSRRFSAAESRRKMYRLDSRGLVVVSGLDAANFLQGLITNNVQSLGKNNQWSFYSMMLNAQGRVLYDLIIHHVICKDQPPSYYIECDRQVTDNFIKILHKYKIRKKVDIRNASDEYKTYAHFADPATTSPSQILTDGSQVLVYVRDPRVSSFGWRVLLSADIKDMLLLNGAICDEKEYHLHRYKMGICEGTADLPPGNCFPLESNLVYMNGVSFQKGCYIGQELTARTHHTGAIRKRLMPLAFDRETEFLPPNETITTDNGKSVGKFRSGLGQFGLGLMNVEKVKDREKTYLLKGNCKVTIQTPPWWPQDSGH